MIKHIWSILCLESIINSETNNISLLNVFEKIDVKVKLPVAQKRLTAPVNYELVSLWVKTSQREEKIDLKVSIISPEGKILKELFQTFSVPLEKKRLRSRLKINGLELTKSGNYLFKIAVKKENKKSYRAVAEIPLEVEIHKELLKS